MLTFQQSVYGPGIVWLCTWHWEPLYRVKIKLIIMIESIKTKWQISHPKYKVCHLVFINSILIVSQTRHRRFSVSKSVYNKISNVRKKGCPKLRANYANKNKTDVLYPQRKLPCCWLSCPSSSFVTHQRSHWIACIKT